MLQYDREAAVAYAHRWAFDRNPDFYNYDGIGGDCTNFASQVLLAGGAPMNYTPTFGWYYIDANNKAPAWTGVEYLYRFLTGDNPRCGPRGMVVPLEQIEPGDIIQLSFDGETFAHTPVVVSVGSEPTPEQILVAAHTIDSDNRPLATYDYQALRPIHITHLIPCRASSPVPGDLRPPQS